MRTSREGPTKPSLTATKELFGHTRRTLALVWASSPSLLVALSLLSASGAFLPLLVAYAGKRIIDGVVLHDRALTLDWVALELLFVALPRQISAGRGSCARSWARASART